ncbi:Uncharacterised protein [uncultured archaeon]|nr:Uncharacterised protein [uncultured archaeon]
MGLGWPAETPEVRLSDQLRCSTVLTDLGSLVGYGAAPYRGEPLFAKAMVADQNPSVRELVGVQQLQELLLDNRFASGNVDCSGLAQELCRIFWW